MKIRFSPVTENEIFDSSLEERLHDEAIPAAGPVCVTMTVTKSGCEVVMRGSLTIALESECSRCLQKFHYTVNSSFEYDYQLDRALEKSEIDISDDVRETIIVALPEKPLCRKDCRGICPQCGTVRNIRKCSCIQSKHDDRMEALKKYKFK